ncbi:MAG TPA: TonB family protein [Polymorphobacter sp.]|nr:TonB family protein [Polymorphobacter sp.]
MQRKGWLALAVAAVVATPVAAAMTPAKLAASPYTAGDYPQSASRNSEMGYARIRVIVSPQGKPIDCAVVDSSGTASLDAASCAVMLKRGAFTPARDDNGQPAFAVHEQTVPWFIAFNARDMRAREAQVPRPSDIDVEVNVASLPAGLVAPLAVIADVMVNNEGRVVQCAADAGASVPPPALARAACTQVGTLVKFEPARDAGGTRVASVQQAKVVFLVEAPAATK